MPDTFRLHCRRCGCAFLETRELFTHRGKCSPAQPLAGHEPSVPFPEPAASPTAELRIVGNGLAVPARVLTVDEWVRRYAAHLADMIEHGDSLRSVPTSAERSHGAPATPLAGVPSPNGEPS